MYQRITEGVLRSFLEGPEILILYGPRRVGKTTLLKKLYDDLAHSNPAVIYSLDDPGAQAVWASPSIDRIAHVFVELGFLPGRRAFLFLDEIQYFPRIDLLLKLIFDHFPQVKVVATSSSSLLLLQGLTDSLAGRKYFIELLPLTLGEVSGVSIKDYFTFPESITLQGSLSQSVLSFALYGSYPEVLNKEVVEEKQEKLRDLLDSALYKDIFLLENIKAPQVLVKLVALLAYQIGNLVNLNELATQLGVSRNTADQYIQILEKYFLVFRLPPFARNHRNELNTKHKIYFWDLGIRNMVIRRFFPFEIREDRGALFENLIIASILKRNIYERRPFNAYYWRTYQGYEVDLVLEHVQQQELWAFQISLSGQASFSRTFDIYRPAKNLVVHQENAYRFCW